jgi:hypothetical protein
MEMFERSNVTFVTDGHLIIIVAKLENKINHLQQRTSNFDQIFNHLYLENEKNCIRIFFLSMTSSHHHQLPVFFPNWFQNHSVCTNFIRIFFCLTSSHHHQLPFFFPNLFQNHPVCISWVTEVLFWLLLLKIKFCYHTFYIWLQNIYLHCEKLHYLTYLHYSYIIILTSEHYQNCNSYRCLFC